MPTTTVMTYNVRHCRGLDDVVDVSRIGSVIARATPHLVALQELDVGLERSRFMDQPVLLARATGLHIYFHATIARDGGRYGIALAATQPLEMSVLELPRSGSEEPRALLMARWEGAVVLATHLSRDRKARRAQIGFVARLAADTDGPVILLGDLNESPDRLSALHQAGLEGPRLLTHPARRPRDQKDYILVSEPAVVESWGTIATSASDHLPVVAGLRL